MVTPLALDLGDDGDAMEVDGARLQATPSSASPGGSSPGARGGLETASVRSALSDSVVSTTTRRVGLVLLEASGPQRCRGRVGSRKGLFFCTRPADCSIKAHAVHRTDVPAGFVYIAAERGDKAFEMPRLSTAGMGKAAVAELLRERRPVREWIVRLKHLERAHAAVVAAPSSPEDTSSAMEDGRILPSRTPFKKLRLSQDQYASPMRTSEWRAMEGVEPAGTPDVADVTPAYLDVEQASVQRIAKAVNGLITSAEALNEKTTRGFEQIAHGINEVGSLAQEADNKVVLVDSKVGDLPPWVGDPDVVTLWGAIGETRELMDSLDSAIIQVHRDQEQAAVRNDKQLAQLLNSTSQMDGRLTSLYSTLAKLKSSPPSDAQERIERIETNLRGPVSEAIRSIRRTLNRVQQAAEAIDGITGRLGDVEAALGRLADRVGQTAHPMPAAQAGTNTETSLQEPLLDPGIFPMSPPDAELTVLGGSGPRSGQGECHGACRFTAAWQQRVATLEAQVASLRDAEAERRQQPMGDPSVAFLLREQVTRVQKDMADLSTRVDGSSVTIGGRTFQGVTDCEKFVRECIPGHGFDWFYDVLSLLQRVSQSTMTTSEALAHETHLKKAGYRMQGGGSIRASFLTNIPTILGKGEGDAYNPAKPLPNIPTPEVFGVLSEDGLGGRIEADMAGAVDAINGGIGVTFAERPQGTAVVTAMVRDSWAHWQHISRFLTDTYTLLGNKSTKADIKKAHWKLVCRVVRKLIEKLQRARHLGVDLKIGGEPGTEAGGDNIMKSARILWGALQTHRIMREVVRVKLRHHGIAVAEFTNHLVETQVHDSVLKEMNDRLAKLDGRVNALVQKANAGDKGSAKKAGKDS